MLRGSKLRSEDPKLIIRVISVELVQPVRPRYFNVTDRRTTYDSNTALAGKRKLFIDSLQVAYKCETFV